MSDEIYDIKAGRLLYFTQGEYSNYDLEGTFVALQDIDNAKITECAAAASKNRAAGYGPASAARGGVIAEMIRAGLLLEVDMTEVWLGSYGIAEVFGTYPDEWEPNP